MVSAGRTQGSASELLGNPAAREFLHGRIEVLLTRQIQAEPNEWECLVRPGRKIGVGERLFFGEHDELQAEVMGLGEFGERTICFGKSGWVSCLAGAAGGGCPHMSLLTAGVAATLGLLQWWTSLGWWRRLGTFHCLLTSPGLILRATASATRRCTRGSGDRSRLRLPDSISLRTFWTAFGSVGLKRQRLRCMSGWERFSRCEWNAWKNIHCTRRLIPFCRRVDENPSGAKPIAACGCGWDHDGADAGACCPARSRRSAGGGG